MSRLIQVQTDRTTRPWQIAVFSGAVFCFWMALYLYAPTLPIYVQQYSPHLGAVGLVLSMYGLWQGLLRFPLGWATDLVGRAKPFIMFGYLMAGLGAWLIGFADGILWLGVARSVTGLAAATWVPVVVVFCRFFPPAQTIRASALLGMIGSTARILATGSTGFLNAAGGYVLAFNLAAAVAILAFLLMILVPETPRPAKRPALGPIRTLVSRPQVLYPALLNAFAQLINWAVTFSFIPVLAENMGASDVAVGLLITAYMAVNLVGLSATAAFVNRLGASNLVRIEFLILGLATLTAAFAPNVWWLFVAQGLMGLGTGIGYPTLMGLSIREVSDHERTAAMGLHQGIYGLGMFTGPFIAGFLSEHLGIQITFLLFSIPAILFLIPQVGGPVLAAATAEQSGPRE